MARWHDDENLKGRFHPDYPNDLQVLVHEGSFRFTDARPEAMWAQIHTKIEWTSQEGEVGGYYKAILLNQPHQLKTLQAGQEILLVAHKNYQLPIRITYDYLKDRANYIILPCNKCGLPELFDPISKLIEHTFPDLKKQLASSDVGMPIFSSICPVCGGTMMVKHKKLADIPQSQAETNPPATKPDNSLLSNMKKWFRKQ